VRAVTADHVLFNECIAAFRPCDVPLMPENLATTHSYVFLGFELPELWVLPNCTIHPTMRVYLPGAYSALISRIDNPKGMGFFKPHLFGIALSSILSFSCGRACSSPRDDYLCRPQTLSDSDLAQMAIQHPVLTAGPGNVQISISSEQIKRHYGAMTALVNNLLSVDENTFLAAMQAIRLVQLSLLNKRNDFGLAYLLIVSAIEAVAQKAIKRDRVKVKHPSEERWRIRAEQDIEFNDVLSAYLESRGKEQYLKERYVSFIKRFAPVADWEEIVAHPSQDFVDYFQERSPSHNMAYVVKKMWFEKYPSDLPEQQIDQILEDSYTHRSCFIHRGEQPPHREPNSGNRFFQEYYEYNESEKIKKLLPNYELLVGIAQKSITSWLDKKMKTNA
jgi:hypothetical protein